MDELKVIHLDETEVVSWMPCPGGISVEDAVVQLSLIAATKKVVGAGLTGFLRDPRNVESATRLCAALGL